MFKTDKPKLLDLFCGAGGATKGYQLAGFEVVGVDIVPQPRYVGEHFFQMDALEYLCKYGTLFDVIHASPPCQSYSVTKTLTTKEYPKLIEPVRELLQKLDIPYVIENVVGAPLLDPLILCGTMFDLKVIRHRLFEIYPYRLTCELECHHIHRTAKRGEYDRGQHGYITVAGHNFNVAFAKQAMGIDWMRRDELAESIPPKYTEYIGNLILKELKHHEIPSQCNCTQICLKSHQTGTPDPSLSTCTVSHSD